MVLMLQARQASRDESAALTCLVIASITARYWGICNSIVMTAARPDGFTIFDERVAFAPHHYQNLGARVVSEMLSRLPTYLA